MSTRHPGSASISRRGLLRATAIAGGSALLPTGAGLTAGQAPAQIRRSGRRPSLPSGVQTGDLSGDRAVIWSRCDAPARMVVEWSTRESFTDVNRVAGPAALETTDFTARVDLGRLPAGQRIFYRVFFDSLSDPGVLSDPVQGSLQTPSRKTETVRFAWGGDVCGQGWGINPDLGGMRIWESIRRFEPHFFIHSGDCIYADNPILPEVKLEDGAVWKNLVTAEKSKVAETLAGFHGAYAYNLMDANLRRFNAEVPVLVQWDNHETVNNWSPGKRMDSDLRYGVKSVDLLAARARRAFLDYYPLRPDPHDPERIYRSYQYGPLLEVFMLDARSYRSRNNRNDQPTSSADSAFLGDGQVQWLQSRLRASKATWKIIACDMPLGLIIKDGADYEAVANQSGPPLGRELEIAGLLRFIRDKGVRNVVWLTADVHYAAAHYFDPNRARFQDFHPFWEFIAGPLNAGTFGPGVLDDTFGPQVKFTGIPAGMKPNRPPTDGYQFFGAVSIDGKSKVAAVSLRNLRGEILYTIELHPER